MRSPITPIPTLRKYSANVGIPLARRYTISNYLQGTIDWVKHESNNVVKKKAAVPTSGVCSVPVESSFAYIYIKKCTAKNFSG